MTTKKDELKIEQGGLVDKLRTDLSSEQRIAVRKRLAEIDKELTQLHADQNRHYLHVLSYDKKTRQFQLYKSPQPIKGCDVYYVVIRKYKYNLIDGKLKRVHCDRDKMYKMKSGKLTYFLQSKDRHLLQRYVSHLGIDGVEVQERLSKEKQAEQDREDWKFDGDAVKPLTTIPRDGTFTLEGRRLK